MTLSGCKRISIAFGQSKKKKGKTECMTHAERISSCGLVGRVRDAPHVIRWRTIVYRENGSSRKARAPHSTRHIFVNQNKGPVATLLFFSPFFFVYIFFVCFLWCNPSRAIQSPPPYFHFTGVWHWPDVLSRLRTTPDIEMCLILYSNKTISSWKRKRKKKGGGGGKGATRNR